MSDEPEGYFDEPDNKPPPRSRLYVVIVAAFFLLVATVGALFHDWTPEEVAESEPLVDPAALLPPMSPNEHALILDALMTPVPEAVEAAVVEVRTAEVALMQSPQAFRVLAARNNLAHHLIEAPNQNMQFVESTLAGCLPLMKSDPKWKAEYLDTLRMFHAKQRELGEKQSPWVFKVLGASQ